MIYTKNFRRTKNGQRGYAPKREKRPLSWEIISRLVEGAGVALNVEDSPNSNELGRVEMAVALPSGRTHSRRFTFKIREGLYEDAAKVIHRHLVSFEYGRGIEARFNPRKEAPNPEMLADVAAAYGTLDAAAGALLRAEIAA